MSELTLSSPSPASRRWRGRLQLIALFAVFIGPVLAAYWLYFSNQGSHHFGNKAHGQLLDPVVALEPFTVPEQRGGTLDLSALRGHWSLIQLGGQQCDASCERNRVLFRDIWLALGKDAKRVKRWFVGSSVSAAVLSDFPQLRWVPQGEATGLLTQLEQAASALGACDNCSYLIDPNGNVVMRYPVEQPPTQIFKDLRLLLKVSQIG